MTLDIEPLLAPISDHQPCGEDCSFSNDFHAIKKAKTQDDPLLDQGDWISEPRQADWQFVLNKSVELLSNKTKDLRLYTWLTEAWTHTQGFKGIARGLELSHLSIQQYWQDLHPLIEDEDLDQRLGLLQGLINQIPALMKQVPIVSQAPFYHLGNYETFLHQQNVRLRQSQDEDSESLNSNEGLQNFEQLLQATSRSVQLKNYQQVLDIQQHWQQLKTILDELLSLDAPSFSAIDEQIDSIVSQIKRLYKVEQVSNQNIESLIQPKESVIQIAYADTASPVAQTQFRLQPQNHLANREQALKVLNEIADYFQTHEPHSPVSYMLQKTIRWSQMPLHEWLAQVIKNENPLEQVQELLGVHDMNNSTSEW
ncbi:type VI secretion system protein TssA [Acinetobacter sp. LoGeW2-3]|uniref:type VI secretion system protein TssA n=1 Tax=Acinetobacter sp. LoGeW2-3 TaxID=1808001 RepID=UPI000C05AC55|nr:type VI secretion system protein TssA [Acinetobacter sp. LoGeW2-3]ATO20571.1 type VI secretion system protein TssA [Acinetobacter sp. LoGeW2-3]